MGVVRVVLVDNDPDALDLLELDLGLEGHEIVGTAAQGDEAIEVVTRVLPDVAVLDYRMPPGMNGLELAKRLRHAAPTVRLLMYSNHVRTELLAEAARLRVPYLRKGNLAELRRAIVSSAGA